MSARPRIFFLLLIAGLLGACQRAPEMYREQFFAFGTLIEISIYGEDPALAAQAIHDIENLFNQWHADWHAWQAGALTDINQTMANGATATVADPVLLELIKQAHRLSVASEGRFNPAAGALFALWGFNRNDSAAGPVPTSDAIDHWLQQSPSMTDLNIEGNHISSRNPALRLDLGAIAKGYASQLAIDTLKARGIHNAIVAAAGDLHVIGRPGKRAWHIGIRHPRAVGIIAAAELADGESISTSGDYERFFEQDGKHYHHLLDPANGRPANGTASVTVIHQDGASADAAATALFIAGDRWPAVARAMGVDTVMRIDTEGKVELSPAMAKRIEFEDPAPKQVEVQSLL